MVARRRLCAGRWGEGRPHRASVGDGEGGAATRQGRASGRGREYRRKSYLAICFFNRVVKGDKAMGISVFSLGVFFIFFFFYGLI